jgi:hypothetical protein
MPTPSPAVEAELVSAARQRQATLITALSVAALSGAPGDVHCDLAVTAIDRYSTSLLDELLAATRPLAAPETEWVKTRYLSLMLEFATAACNVVQEPGLRHTVAQEIQCRVLWHEHHLRTMLKSG